MTLAQRVRDYRYAKGWGPDELASRASISRTALYQIESGKTEQPRAGTLRRIAEALNVPTELLLGQQGLGTVNVSYPGSLSAEIAPVSGLSDAPESLSFNGSNLTRPVARPSTWSMSPRERELDRKFHELLASPLGESVARIIEESYRMMPHAPLEAIH